MNEIYVTPLPHRRLHRDRCSPDQRCPKWKKRNRFVELKARFDEANNIRWSKTNESSTGVRIIYSIPGLKVHAKVARVNEKIPRPVLRSGLPAISNESTARVYTDHILFTANKEMLRELELLFLVLAKRKQPDSGEIPSAFAGVPVQPPTPVPGSDRPGN